MRLILLEENDSHVYTLSHKHRCTHTSPILGVFTTRCVLFRDGVIMSHFNKMILCHYLSESWSHEFEFYAAQVGWELWLVVGKNCKDI